MSLPRSAALAGVWLGLLTTACVSTEDPRNLERPTGCVDTPFIGPDHKTMSSGVQCGRAPSPHVKLVQGRVVADAGAGLPGQGLEGLRVSVHAIDGPLRLDALPPVLAETRSGPQGSFSVSISTKGVSSLVVVVRPASAGPPLAARRLEGVEPPDQLTILIPREPTPEPTPEPADGPVEAGGVPRPGLETGAAPARGS